MRTLDTATLDAIGDRGGVVLVNFVLVTAKDAEGDGQFFGFTDYGEDVAVNVIDGLTGDEVNRTYYGDNAPLQGMDPIPMRVGIDEVTTTQVVLNPHHDVVQLMYRGHDCRNAPVQIHRGYLSRESHLLVAAPRIRRLGWVNGAPEELAPAGGVSRLRLEVVSVTRELTRINPARRSDETQRLRSDDRARRYSGTAYQWQIFWGEAKRQG